MQAQLQVAGLGARGMRGGNRGEGGAAARFGGSARRRVWLFGHEFGWDAASVMAHTELPEGDC